MKYKPVFTTDFDHKCELCIFDFACNKDGICKCDQYRYDNELYEIEEDIYFVKDEKIN